MKKHSADARKILATLLWRYRELVSRLREAEADCLPATSDYFHEKALEAWACYVAAREALGEYVR